MSWIGDASFSLECSNSSLKIEINASNYSLSFQYINNSYNITLYSSNNTRVSFNGSRLFDMHNLKVLNGDKAKETILNLLKNANDNIKDEINKLAIRYDIPVKLLTEMLNLVSKLEINPLNCLDIKIKYIYLGLTNDFVKQSQFSVNKKFKIIMNSNECIKAVINLDNLGENNSFLFSKNCVEYVNDLEGFRNYIYNYKTINEKYLELINYLKAKLS
ncbi:MAG: hypothetical protein QXD56_06650 [Saccharolobus sp.]